MMRSIRLIAAVGLLGFGVVPAAQAQNAKADLGEAWIRARIGQGRDQKTDELRQQLHMQFYNSDIDGGGVSAKDYELAEIMDKAQQRASRIMQALTRDLDGDGAIEAAVGS